MKFFLFRKREFNYSKHNIEEYYIYILYYTKSSVTAKMFGGWGFNLIYLIYYHNGMYRIKVIQKINYTGHKLFTVKYELDYMCL